MTCQNRRRLRAFALLGLSCTVLSGCGSAEKGLVPVSGKVTLDGGPWAKPGKITFTPTSSGPGGEVRPASADFGTDGTFTVTSYEGTKGLYPGEYEAAVECWETPPGMSDPNAAANLTKGMKPGAGKSYVPSKYQNAKTSGFTLKVASGSPATADFDVKTK